MTRDGNYYSATVADFAGRDAAMYRSMGPSRRLRTVQYNSRWLNGSPPSLLSSSSSLAFILCPLYASSLSNNVLGLSVRSLVSRFLCSLDDLHYL